MSETAQTGSGGQTQCRRILNCASADITKRFRLDNHAFALAPDRVRGLFAPPTNKAPGCDMHPEYVTFWIFLALLCAFAAIDLWHRLRR
jgi:hypothetical protein